jgi:hypothetical protein
MGKCFQETYIYEEIFYLVFPLNYLSNHIDKSGLIHKYCKPDKRFGCSQEKLLIKDEERSSWISVSQQLLSTSSHFIECQYGWEDLIFFMCGILWEEDEGSKKYYLMKW